MAKKLILKAKATPTNSFFRHYQHMTFYRVGDRESSGWDCRKDLATPVDKCVADEVHARARERWTAADWAAWSLGFEELDDG